MNENQRLSTSAGDAAMSISSVSKCPICNNHASQPYCRKETFLIFKCPVCELEYVTNPPSPEELETYYSREEYYQGGETEGYNNYDEQTEESIEAIRSLLESYADKKGCILDVGCGYGSHLAIAASMGWQCFGVELSEHARGVANERLGLSVEIAAKVDDIRPCAFDIVLLLDVIEHVSDPYSLFYPLFAAGSIQENTVVVITTPNAGSITAKTELSDWIYRHPPSHLTFFTKKSLETLFDIMQFAHIEVEGIHPTEDGRFTDLTIEKHAGLLLKASGSDCQSFIQKRYEPSSWSNYLEVHRRQMIAKAIAKSIQERVILALRSL
jgi:SAM-dependent methyltransferase